MATLCELAASIVASHAETTPMTTDQLLKEIDAVFSALQALEAGKETATPAGEISKPSLTVKQAFKKDEVICMVCGKGGMKTLTRHIRTAHNMRPGHYRKQFGIPRAQSLTAKNFSESRKKMAEERGLGDVLAKAREVRAANIKAKKSVPVKKATPAKKAAPVKSAKPMGAKKAKQH